MLLARYTLEQAGPGPVFRPQDNAGGFCVSLDVPGHRHQSGEVGQGEHLGVRVIDATGTTASCHLPLPVGVGRDDPTDDPPES